MVEVPGNHPRVRAEPDEDEQTRRLEERPLLRHEIVQVEAGHPFLRIALDLLRDRVPDYFDLRILEHVLLQNLGGPELVAPVNQVHLARVPRQEIGLLDRGIAPSDDRHDLLLEECGVADRAVRHSLARVLQLARNPELDRSSAGGHDRCRRAKDIAVVGLRVKIPIGHFRHRCHRHGLEELRAELLGVSGELLRQLVPEDLRKTNHVIEVLGVQQLSTRKPALYDRGPQHGATRVERRRHSRRPGPHNDNVVFTHCRQTIHLKGTVTSETLYW